MTTPKSIQQIESARFEKWYQAKGFDADFKRAGLRPEVIELIKIAMKRAWLTSRASDCEPMRKDISK